jgi:hypothetical protein
MGSRCGKPSSFGRLQRLYARTGDRSCRSMQPRAVPEPTHPNPQHSRAVRFGDERFFRPMQIALRLGYKDDGAVWRAIRSGELRAFQPSDRKVVVAESEIELWLASKAVEATELAAARAVPEKPMREKPRRRRGTDMPLIGRTVVKK